MTPTPPRKGFFIGTPWKHPHPSGHEADPAKTQLACSKRSQLNSPRPKPNSCESWAEASTQGCGSSLNGPWPSPKNNRADPVCCCSQRGRPHAESLSPREALAVPGWRRFTHPSGCDRLDGHRGNLCCETGAGNRPPAGPRLCRCYAADCAFACPTWNGIHRQ